MGFLLVLAMICAITFGVALLVSSIECTGGYLGDSSLVPSILVIGLAVLAAAVIIGYCSGHLVIGVN